MFYRANLIIVQMKSRRTVRSNTPNSLLIRSEGKPKSIHQSKSKRKSIKSKCQLFLGSSYRPSVRASNEGVLGNKMKPVCMSRELEEKEIQFMSKHLLTRDENWKTGAKNKKEAFEFVSVIGCGVFGKVWKAKDKNTGKFFAIKQMSKAEIISKKGLKICFNERRILPQLHFSLIPALYSAFQTELDLYLVFPWLSGGDLRYHLTKFKYFEQKQVRFFAACIISSLQYLRFNNILHRDLKPENLIFDQTGYLFLADFGISSNISESGLWMDCGTPAYMAPEILFGKQPSFEADYYALGIILYEIVMGQRPYSGITKSELKKCILESSLSIKKDKIPDDWSIQAIHFINQLLHRNQKNRLGRSNINELKQHPWLRDFPWEALSMKKLQSPYQQSFKEWEVDYEAVYDQQSNHENSGLEKELMRGQMQQLFNSFNLQVIEKSVEWTTKPSVQIKRLNH